MTPREATIADYLSIPIDDVSVLVRKDCQVESGRGPFEPRPFSCPRSDSDNWFPEMGYDHPFNDASQPECDTTGAPVHLSDEEVQSRGERKEGQ